MYNTHVPPICAAMRSSPELFTRGVMFAVLSARTHFTSVPDQMADLDRRGDASRHLFSWKVDTYRHLADPETRKPSQACHNLWREVCASNSTEESLRLLTAVPGLGIAKAAFVLQFMGHDIACLDSRNAARENKDPARYNGHGRKGTPYFDRKIEQYVREFGGRAQELWDAWCEEVASVYGMPAEDISRLHLDTIVPPNYLVPKGRESCVVPFIGGSQDVPF